MSKITVQGSLKTDQIEGSSDLVKKRIVSDLDKIQANDSKKPFSRLAEDIVIEPYRDGEYQYHAILSEAAKMQDLSPQIQGDARLDDE